ncbi:MAG: TIGR00269 family protein [Conexivisphaerales archaeon]
MVSQKCDKCNRNVFYYRRYSGERLCSYHFSESIEDKVRKTISKYKMLRHGERVGVAVSGGKDSLSLLYILSKILPEHDSELCAITVDEGIRGYRDESLLNVKEVAERLGVELLIVSYKELFGFTQDHAMMNRTSKISSCAMCGTLRRRALDIAAKRLGLNVLATAHNLDDMIQTFLINFMNGDINRMGWTSASSQSNAFPIRRIHPFMEIYEKEAALYAFANELPVQSEHCPYMNEGIRSSIRVYLNTLEEEHPGIKYMMLKSALMISERIKSEHSKPMECSKCGLPSSGPICSACMIAMQIGSTMF